MTLARALTLAPAGAVLVGRPASPVAHVYVGPLTRSRRYVPRAARPVCRARTNRLHVQEQSLLLVAAKRHLCAHCSARLAAADILRAGRASSSSSPAPSPVPEPVTRDSLRASYDDLTPFDIALGAFTAQTVEEVERLELLALLVVGHPACANDPVVSPVTGKVSAPVDVHIARARARIGAHHDDPWRRELLATSAQRARANAEEQRLLTREAKQRAVDALGFSRARDLERRPVQFVDARSPSANTG